MSYESELSAWGRAADTEVVTLEQALLEKNAEIEFHLDVIDEKNVVIMAKDAALVKKNATIVRLRAERDALKVALKECQGGVGTDPEPVNFSRVFGSSTGAHTYAEFTARAGAPLKVRRSYDQVLEATFAQTSAAQDVGKCVSVLSYKADIRETASGALDDRLLTMLRSVPDTHDLRLIFWHEPENDTFGPDIYLAAQRRVRTQVSEANKTRTFKIRFGGVLMAASTQGWSTSADANDYFPGADVWDFIAWDGYSWEGDREAGEIFQKCLEFCQTNGVEFAVGETGAPVNSYNGRRDQWITRSKDWAMVNGCEFWCYWDGSFGVSYLDTDNEFKAVVLGH